METKLSKKESRASYLLAISCCAIFLLSTGIKNVYASALIPIKAEFGLTDAQATIGNLLYYCVYGAAQIILALFFKKFNIKRIFLPAVILTSICYSLMTIANAPWKLWVILGVCGILDAPLWAGCIHFVGKFLRGKYIAKANAVLSLATPLGLALGYVAVATFVKTGPWKLSFLVLAVLMFASAVLFKYSEITANKILTPIEKKATQAVEQTTPSKKRFYLLVVIYVALFVGLLNGARYTMNQFVPVMIFDVYKWPDSLSIITAVILPIVNAVANVITSKMFEKGVYYLKLALIVAAISASSSIALLFLFDAGAVWFVIISVVFTCWMSVVSQIFIGFFPLVIGKKFSAGAAGAMSNGFSAVCSGVMPFISALLIGSDKNNLLWDNACLLMIAISTLVVVMITVLVITRRKNALLNENIYDET